MAATASAAVRILGTFTASLSCAAGRPRSPVDCHRSACRVKTVPDRPARAGLAPARVFPTSRGTRRRSRAPEASGGEAHGQLVEPVDAGDRAELGLAVELEAVHVLGEERQALLQLHTREVRAEAVVDARAERERA